MSTPHIDAKPDKIDLWIAEHTYVSDDTDDGVIRSAEYDSLKADLKKLIARERLDERRKTREFYAKRNPQFTRKWVADALGISRPTLNKWIENPEMFTVGAIRKLAQLEAQIGEKNNE